MQIPARELERAFEALLGRLAAPEEAVRYVDRMISAAIASRGRELRARLLAAEKRLETTERKLDRLLQMRIDGEVSAEEYRTARERLSIEQDAARVELGELTMPIDVDHGSASAWASRFLTRPGEVWRELDGDRRARFAERAFPTGIEWRDRDFSNPTASLFRLPLAPVAGPPAQVVHPTGPDANLTAAAEWVRALRSLEAELYQEAA